MIRVNFRALGFDVIVKDGLAGRDSVLFYYPLARPLALLEGEEVKVYYFVNRQIVATMEVACDQAKPEVRTGLQA